MSEVVEVPKIAPLEAPLAGHFVPPLVARFVWPLAVHLLLPQNQYYPQGNQYHIHSRLPKPSLKHHDPRLSPDQHHPLHLLPPLHLQSIHRSRVIGHLAEL